MEWIEQSIALFEFKKMLQQAFQNANYFINLVVHGSCHTIGQEVVLDNQLVRQQ